MVNFHYVALHLAHKSVLFISIQHTPLWQDRGRTGAYIRRNLSTLYVEHPYLPLSEKGKTLV